MNNLDLDVLTEFGRVHNLTGKDNGQRARTALALDELDKNPDGVTVCVPDHLYAISSSFFLGLFSQSLQQFGSREAFLKHYKFIADQVVMEQIEDGIRRWLTRRTALEPAA